MSYFTSEQLKARYPNSTKESNEETFDAYVRQVEGEINGYFAVKYAVPFAEPVPWLVNDLSIDLCYLKMMATKDPKMTKALRESFDKRIDRLMKGELVLVASDGTVATDEATSSVVDKDYHSAFGPDDPVNWGVDSDAIRDAEDARSDD